MLAKPVVRPLAADVPIVLEALNGKPFIIEFDTPMAGNFLCKASRSRAVLPARGPEAIEMTLILANSAVRGPGARHDPLDLQACTCRSRGIRIQCTA